MESSSNEQQTAIPRSTPDSKSTTAEQTLQAAPSPSAKNTDTVTTTSSSSRVGGNTTPTTQPPTGHSPVKALDSTKVVKDTPSPGAVPITTSNTTTSTTRRAPTGSSFVKSLDSTKALRDTPSPGAVPTTTTTTTRQAPTGSSSVKSLDSTKALKDTSPLGAASNTTTKLAPTSPSSPKAPPSQPGRLAIAVPRGPVRRSGSKPPHVRSLSTPLARSLSARAPDSADCNGRRGRDKLATGDSLTTYRNDFRSPHELSYKLHSLNLETSVRTPVLNASTTYRASYQWPSWRKHPVFPPPENHQKKDVAGIDSSGKQRQSAIPSDGMKTDSPNITANESRSRYHAAFDVGENLQGDKTNHPSSVKYSVRRPGFLSKDPTWLTRNKTNDSTSTTRTSPFYTDTALQSNR